MVLVKDSIVIDNSKYLNNEYKIHEKGSNIKLNYRIVYKEGQNGK